MRELTGQSVNASGAPGGDAYVVVEVRSRLVTVDGLDPNPLVMADYIEEFDGEAPAPAGTTPTAGTAHPRPKVARTASRVVEPGAAGPHVGDQAPR